MFTEAEIELISDGLDALEAKAGSDFVEMGLIGAIFSNNKDEYKDMLEKQAEEYRAKSDERKLLRQRIILLKAKLIQMSDALAVKDATSTLLEK